MSENNRDLTFLWIKKAENDIISAKHILAHPQSPTDTVCFHAQQTVEKALKALLTFHGTPFPKTHQLVSLLDIALPFIEELEVHREKLAAMTQYAVGIRYPDDWFEPSREEAKTAVQDADKILKIIKDRLS